jgi:HD-like signal output (HDOD) protein
VGQLGIPPCPPLLADLIQEAEQPQPDRRWVLQLIQQDDELAQALIASVNSPLCGLRHKVSTLNGAVTFGGLKYCANFVAGFMLRRALRAAGNPVIEAFWESAAERSFIIAYLARELGVSEFDDAHTFGLFRNCGIPLMLSRHADYAVWRAREQERGLADITAKERARFGIDHALIGGLLARSWCMSKAVWLPVSLHHVRGEIGEGDEYAEEARNLIAIGMLADCIARSRRRAPPTELWESEQAYALRLLGLLPQDLASLRDDIAPLFGAP